MDKVLGEYYTTIVWTMWLIWVPMVVRGEYGLIPSLCSVVVVAPIVLLLTYKAATQSKKARIATLAGSFVALIAFGAVMITPERADSDSEVQTQAE